MNTPAVFDFSEIAARMRHHEPVATTEGAQADQPIQDLFIVAIWPRLRPMKPRRRAW
jgi:hypothetical protein